MPCRYSFLTLLFLTIFCSPLVSDQSGNELSPGKRIIFAGDIMLSRLVEQEMRLSGNDDQWHGMKSFFTSDSIIVGNLEGAVGSSGDCADGIPSNLCFPVLPIRIPYLKKAGFTALVNENNHALNLGNDGVRATIESLIENDLIPIRFSNSPVFIKADDITIGIVAYSVFPDEKRKRIIADSREMKRKMRLAAALSDVVAVYAHWGVEFRDWASPFMREEAKKLVESGADIILGAHPHVIIKPECVYGRPVFYSLGNHVFDQKYTAAKRGLLAVCDLNSDSREVACSATSTSAKPNSRFPIIESFSPEENSGLMKCSFSMRSPIEINDIVLRAETLSLQPNEIVLEGWIKNKRVWRSRPSEIISLSSGRISYRDDEILLFAVEKKLSRIDGEHAPRPYVYRVSKKRLDALWRGSALAWPLVDASVICSDSCFLCALHRGDSFLLSNPNNNQFRLMTYSWNGFGFKSSMSEEFLSQCSDFFDAE